MKKLGQFIIVLVFLFGTKLANADPSLTISANSLTGIVKGGTNTVFNVRVSLVANDLSGQSGKFSILLRNPDNKGLAPWLSYYTKQSESLVGGVWASQVSMTKSPFCIKNIPTTTIFNAKLPEGTYEFIFTLFTPTKNYQKNLVIYVYDDDPLRLLSSTLLPDKRRAYNFRIQRKFIEDPVVAPFVMGDFNGWKVQDLKDLDNDGNFEFTIVAFNSPQSLIFGGDHVADNWGNIDFSIYYNPSRVLLLFDLIDGAIFPAGVKPIVVPPGTDRIIRFDTYNAATMVLGIWLNLKEVGASVSAPFHFGTYNNWKPQAFSAIIGSGWAKFYIKIPPNSIFNLAYGGNYNSNSWGNASLSQFWDPNFKNLKVRMINGIPKP